MFKIGCHLSFSLGYLGAAKEIVSLGGNTFQYFSRNPQGGKAKPFDINDVNNFLEYANEHNINQILCHAPYTLNCASAKPETREFAIMILKDDLYRLEHLPNALYNMHPGSFTTLSLDEGIDYIVYALNKVIRPEQKTMILLETMAGKGSEIGRSFEEIATIISRIEHNEKIGVCLDTCHIYSAGYDIVNHLDDVLNEFDKIIGLNRLKAIHLNDSKMPFASFKDRHEKIGDGTIGSKALIEIINHPKLRELPFFLETPNDLDGYKKEIEFLKNNYKK